MIFINMEKIYNLSSKLSGIYKIKNKINNRVYIGSCKCFQVRFYQHEISLLKNKHKNKFLQADFNKCGENAFIFEVLEVVEGNKLDRAKREKEYINEQTNVYNIIKDPTAVDKICFSKNPEETKRKKSEALKGRIVSEETRKKLSEAGKGHQVSIETRQKISEANKGSKRSEEVKNLIKLASGRPCSEERKRKISIGNKGKKRTKEFIENLRKIRVGKKRGKYIKHNKIHVDDHTKILYHTFNNKR